MVSARGVLVLGVALFGVVEVLGQCCPNGCNGHGSCGDMGVCTCFAGYQGVEASSSEQGACAYRTCPYERAWADAPSSLGKFHEYAECANRGVCDRTTGECQCFAGYEGKACARASCEDNCSGHGRCLASTDVGYGVNAGSYSSKVGTSLGADPYTTTSSDFDSGRSMMCVCDAGYEGPSCAMRTCPRSSDVMDTEVLMTQTITVNAQGAAPRSGTTPFFPTIWTGGAFSLSFTSKEGFRYTTTPVSIGATATMSTALTTALQSLPNNVITSITATVAGPTADTTEVSDMIITLVFSASSAPVSSGSTVKGTQNLFELEWKKCTNAGCTPYQAGIEVAVTTTTTSYANDGTTAIAATGAFSTVATTVAGLASYECGNRGVCDHTAGVCECYSGFYGVRCEIQTALL